jgi:hypothetical protein
LSTTTRGTDNSNGLWGNINVHTRTEFKICHKTETGSPKTFLNANGSTSKAGKKAKLQYDMRQPAVDADMVPGLAMNSLLSTSKLADANYITVSTQDEVQVFDAELSQFQVSGKVVMKGWRCPETGLWRVSIKPEFPNFNTDMALLSKEATNIIVNKQGQFDTNEFANNVYKLPNLEQVVAWYHVAAGYPTKPTYLKAIEAGFYASWPLLTAKAARKHFPESPETAKGHMRRVKSGVRSTKAWVEEPEEIQRAEAELQQLRQKHQDIHVKVKEATKMVHTDLIFPLTLSGGHKYIMVLIDIDSNYDGANEVTRNC